MLIRTTQGTMAEDLQHKHPPLLLPRQVRPRAHEERRHHQQQRFHQRIHRPSRLARLHLHQRRHHLLHPRATQPTNLQRDSRQCRLPRARLDSPGPLHHGPFGAGAVHLADGSSCATVGDCNLLCFPGESGQQYDFRAELASQRRCCG